MANPAKFDRCVKKVKGKSRGRVNAYAVCAAAGTRGNPPKTFHDHPVVKKEADAKFVYDVDADEVVATAPGHPWSLSKSKALREKGSGHKVVYLGWPSKSNPEPDSADMYESFHGAPSEEILEFRESEHYHGNLAGLGVLVELKLVTITGYDVTLAFSNPDTLVASNPGLWQRLKGIGSKSTAYSIATHPGRVSDGSKYKGFTIYKHKEGWYRIKELDPRLSFDDVGDAKSYIDDVKPVKANPRADGQDWDEYVGPAPVIPDAPRLLKKVYGPNWMSRPDAVELKKAFSKATSARSKALKLYRAYVDRSNERFHAQKQNPGPVQTSLKYLSKAGSAALKPFDSTFGKMGKYLDNKVGRALKNKKKNPSMDPALLCSNEKGNQVYIVGGDQTIDFKSIHMETIPEKDSMVLGEAYFVSYFTTKDFDDHKPTIYEHDLAEESDPPSPKYKRDEIHTAANRRLCGTGTGCYPTVRYDTLNQKLYLDGGEYKIEKPMFQTSPGIEN